MTTNDDFYPASLREMVDRANEEMEARLAVSDSLFRCSVCRALKQRAEFYPDNRRPCGVSSSCRRCTQKRNRARNEAARKERIRLGLDVVRKRAAGHTMTLEEERIMVSALAAEAAQRRIEEQRRCAELAVDRQKHWDWLRAQCTPEVIERNLAETREWLRLNAQAFSLRRKAAQEADPEKAERLLQQAQTAREGWQAIDQAIAERIATREPVPNFASYPSAS